MKIVLFVGRFIIVREGCLPGSQAGERRGVWKEGRGKRREVEVGERGDKRRGGRWERKGMGRWEDKGMGRAGERGEMWRG